VFSTQWSPDDPLTLAAAGSKGSLQVWDVGANASVQKAFGPKLRAAGRELKEKSGDGLVTMENDSEDDESAWEDEE
jgi:periodic tryptophan protein 1